MVPRRSVTGHRQANALGDLRVQVQVGDCIVEAIADRDELILIDAIDHVRRRGVAVMKPLLGWCSVHT